MLRKENVGDHNLIFDFLVAATKKSNIRLADSYFCRFAGSLSNVFKSFIKQFTFKRYTLLAPLGLQLDDCNTVWRIYVIRIIWGSLDEKKIRTHQIDQLYVALTKKTRKRFLTWWNLWFFSFKRVSDKTGR